VCPRREEAGEKLSMQNYKTTSLGQCGLLCVTKRDQGNILLSLLQSFNGVQDENLVGEKKVVGRLWGKRRRD